MSTQTIFPPGFLWGAATSAYQIEGSPLADGAGPSIWHRFAHTPGLVRDGDTGDVACDHYRRFESDVALMQRSASTRIASASRGPRAARGHGRVNPAGLGFYERLVDGCSRRHPADGDAVSLGPAGGARRSRRLAQSRHRRLVRRLRERRVPGARRSGQEWATLNEPWVVTDGGYLHGALAPGHRSRVRGADRLAQPDARARRGGAGVSRERPQPDRPGREHRAQVPGFQRARPTSPRRARARCLHESAVPRPGAARRAIPRSCARSSARRGPSGRPRTSRADPAADRLHRHQLLHAQRRAARRQRAGRCGAARCARSSAPTPRPVGRCSRKA